MANYNRSKRKRLESISESATNPAAKPGDYLLGSLESRAAARALAEDRDKGGTVLQVVYIGPGGEVAGYGQKVKLPPVQGRPI